MGLVEERFSEYDAAMDADSQAILASRREGPPVLAGDTGGMLLAEAMREHPFEDLALTRLFDLDPEEEGANDGYTGFGFQIKPIMHKTGSLLTDYLKRL